MKSKLIEEVSVGVSRRQPSTVPPTHENIVDAVKRANVRIEVETDNPRKFADDISKAVGIEPPHRIDLGDEELASGPLPKELELSEEEKAEALAQYDTPLELPQEIQTAHTRDTDPLIKVSKRKGMK
ncbi:MAG: hypothetical protein ACRDBH_12315 [Bosea sp. (in: a-proteobacteria)]